MNALDNKLEDVFIALYKAQKYMGSLITPQNFITDSGIDKLLGLTRTDLAFYLRAMINKGWLDTEGKTTVRIPTGSTLESAPFPAELRLSITGYEHYQQVMEAGDKSNKCFIAMSFREDTLPYYENAIKPACNISGFETIRVDREHISSEQSINDYIIASIKRSKFCIADFTHNSSGVYFEAGYALGRGMKVIYTCHGDGAHFDQRHFDIKPLQFIRYATVEEFKDSLINKIEAIILNEK